METADLNLGSYGTVLSMLAESCSAFFFSAVVSSKKALYIRRSLMRSPTPVAVWSLDREISSRCLSHSAAEMFVSGLRSVLS